MVRTIFILFLLSAAGLMSCNDFEQYEADNRGAEEEGYCYPDLEVEGDTMSFVTSDMGRMYFDRKY